MGCRRILLILTSLAVVGFAYIYYKLTVIPPLPELNLEQWWGPGSPKHVEQFIKPFQIAFSDEMIADLKGRLSRTRLTDPLNDVGFTYGTNTKYLKRVLDFWEKEYDFKGREAYFNKYPHYKTNIQGLDIHYIHVKPKVSSDVKVVPILLLHGWPGSVREYYETIPLLTTPSKNRNFVFEIILPSLPGYGFSQATSKKGLGAAEMAVILRNLMVRLGFSSFYLHGGDWGAGIGSSLSVLFSQEVLGYHTTLPTINLATAILKVALGSLYPSALVEEKYQDRLYPMSKKLLLGEAGYFHIQATKPDSLGVALGDSPAGIAAYILEKFSTGTNPSWRERDDGGMEKKFSLTDLIDNLMVYWSSGAITTSMRLYAESLSTMSYTFPLIRQPITVPSAIANFRHEIMYYPESMVKSRFLNIVQFTHFDDGGHFAAFECPKELTEDIWSAVDKMRNVPQKKKQQ